MNRAALFFVAFAACSSPGAPVVPPQTAPAPPGGDLCPRGAVNRFAQRLFRIADLDQGHACEGFIEQDECVIALFRDCTDHTAMPPRSWQGTIDAEKHIVIQRTSEAAGSVGHSPSECSGELTVEDGSVAPINTWAKLECRISVGIHGGFYFEQVEENVPAFLRVEPAMRVEVLLQPPDSSDLPDFAVLAGRQEIWALVATANESSGLYIGPIGPGRLTRRGFDLHRPTRIVVAPDESFVLIADGTKLVRIAPATNTTTTAELSGDIQDLELIAGGVLVSVNAGTRISELRVFDPTTLEALPAITARTLMGTEVVDLVPIDGDPRAIALVMAKDDRRTRLIDAMLVDVGTTEELPETPIAAVAIPGQRVGFIAKSSASYFTLRVNDGTVSPAIHLPAAKLDSLFFSSKTGRLLIAASTPEAEAENRKPMLIPYDVGADRPLLQQIFETEVVADLVREDASGRMFALSKDLGVIDPLLQ